MHSQNEKGGFLFVYLLIAYSKNNVLVMLFGKHLALMSGFIGPCFKIGCLIYA